MKVTIVVRTFKRPEFLKQALSSIQLQTYDNWEVILFDDPLYFNCWLDDASNYELALVYREWMDDELSINFPIDFSIVDECHKRGISLADLEALLISTST